MIKIQKLWEECPQHQNTSCCYVLKTFRLKMRPPWITTLEYNQQLFEWNLNFKVFESGSPYRLIWNPLQCWPWMNTFENCLLFSICVQRIARQVKWENPKCKPMQTLFCPRDCSLMSPSDEWECIPQSLATFPKAGRSGDHAQLSGPPSVLSNRKWTTPKLDNGNTNKPLRHHC